MGDRRIVQYEEPRNEYGPHWTLEIERSSNGAPGGLISIVYTDVQGREQDRMTVVVDDLRVLRPALEWAEAIQVDPDLLESQLRIARIMSNGPLTSEPGE